MHGQDSSSSWCRGRGELSQFCISSGMLSWFGSLWSVESKLSWLFHEAWNLGTQGSLCSSMLLLSSTWASYNLGNCQILAGTVGRGTQRHCKQSYAKQEISSKVCLVAGCSAVPPMRAWTFSKIFCKRWLCLISRGEGNILWTPESLDYSDFHLVFGEFPGSLPLRMFLIVVEDLGTHQPWLCPFDPWILSFISHILILWEHCYSIVRFSWDITDSHPLAHFLLLLDLWEALNCLCCLPPNIVPLCRILATMIDMSTLKVCFPLSESALWIQGLHQRRMVSGLSALPLSQMRGTLEDYPRQEFHFCVSVITSLPDLLPGFFQGAW